MKRLEGKVAIVTAAGSGIGRASAQAFAREGARVVVSDIAPDSGKETVQSIETLGGEAIFVEADASRRPDIERLISETVDRFGRIDCAHNNAGIAESPVLTADLEEEEWDRILALNLKGVWLCMKYEILHMLERGSGAIVNTASVAGLRGVQGQPAYTVSKHGLIGLTRVAAVEYGTSGIRINAVCPGAIRTPPLEEWLKRAPGIEKMVVNQHAVKRLGTPEEVAEAVVWLCSDAASFVTGHAMGVDGGATAF